MNLRQRKCEPEVSVLNHFGECCKNVLRNLKQRYRKGEEARFWHEVCTVYKQGNSRLSGPLMVIYLIVKIKVLYDY